MKNKRQFTRSDFVKNARKSIELSAELLDILEGDYDVLYAYSKKNCRTCFGRGYNEISQPKSTHIKKVVCDCALRQKDKEIKRKIKPIYEVVRNGEKEVVYAKTIDGRIL